jgi:hypothetical protein
MQNNPNWLRYDAEEDKSRHGAVDPDCCEEMEEKYGWKLIVFFKAKPSFQTGTKN